MAVPMAWTRTGSLVASFVLAVAGGAALALAGQPSLELRPLADPDPQAPDGYHHVLVTTPTGQLPDSITGDPGVVSTSQVDGRTWRVTGRLPADQVTAVSGLSTRDDVLMHVTANDTYWNLLWGLENRGGTVGGFPASADADVDGPEVNARATGAGVVVAIVDSGIRPDHPDLPALWRNAGERCGNGVDDDHNGYVDDCDGWDFVHKDNTPYDVGDDNDHGTHVAGTIAAVPNNGRGVAGLAPGVTLMSLKITANGSIWLSDAAQAIRYAADNGAKVINGSFGSRPGTPRAAAAVLEDAVNYARNKGVLFVVAAGNDGTDIDGAAVYPASYAQDNVITVGASTANETVASFSNRGAVGVDLFAPGHFIASTVDAGYAAMQGTSMATPHVAAAAALVLSAEPTLSPAEVRSRLMAESDRVPVYAGKSVSGGRLNADRAVATAAVRLEAASFHDFVADEQHTGTVTVTAASSLFPDGAKVDVTGTLMSSVDGTVYGVADQPVTLNGTETTTDGNARVVLASEIDPSDSVLTGDGVRVALGTSLPAGDYALVVDVVDSARPEFAYGSSTAVFFTVPPAPTAPNTPTVPSAPTPAPGGPAPTTPAPTTPAPTTPAPPSPPAPDGSPPPAASVPGPTYPHPNAPAPTAPGAPTTPAPPTTPANPAPVNPAPGTPTVPGTNPTAPTSPPGPGTTAPTTPANPAPGNPAPGNPAPGNPAPGNPTPANPTPANPAVPGPAPANPAPGNPTPANPTVPGPAPANPTVPGQAPANPNVPGPAPANPAPANPAPGNPAPTNPAPVNPPPAAPAPANPAPAPAPVTDDGMTITSVSPATGPATGGTTVMIMGTNFPQYPVVSIGGAWVYVSSATSMTITVTTPAGTPGALADVLVGDRTGRTVTMRGAFRYQGQPTGSPANPAPQPTQGTSPAPQPTGSTAPVGPAGTVHRPLPQYGAPVTKKGLRLVPVTGNNPLASIGPSWSGWRCAAVRCAGVPVR